MYTRTYVGTWEKRSTAVCRSRNAPHLKLDRILTISRPAAQRKSSKGDAHLASGAMMHLESNDLNRCLHWANPTLILDEEAY